MLHRRAAPVAFLPLLLVFACGAPEPTDVPEAPPAAGLLPVGVQIWNVRREPVTCRVTAVDAGGRAIQLASRCTVPAPREPIAPALGGDRDAVRTVEASLPAGSWTAVVEDGHGRVGRCGLRWPGGNWGIAWVTSTAIHMLADS